ncbi:TonB-dependent receptor [Opitutus sp. ER46]|uniref:TonB-dependent receptor n=1 Tax=Opitutus sp. ER46 TaxID=2161864 RepID=UPI0013047C9D|nr:TonB-dependent receptor [Opitutus sp. ER46]
MTCLAVSRVEAASLSGTVSNAATRRFLEGARVDVPALGLSAITDQTGNYLLLDLPAGTHQVVASYTGLDPIHATVAVGGSDRAVHNFDLTAEVYRLEEFRVSGEREGNAASITRQRTADNVKSVVALDAFGRLSNDNAGELLVRLPGIGGRLDDEGNITGVMIRGTAPGLNTVSVDGNLQASTGGMGRDFRPHAISGALFDEIDVVKAPTPDMPADSLGGSVNFKTRSALDMKETRRFAYRLSGRWAAPFYDTIPMREQRRLHPLLNASYQEVFNAFGGTHNLGISVDAFYSENVSGYYKMIQDYEYTLNSPAYVWDYRTTDGYNNRKQTSTNFKVDYRLSDNSRFFLNFLYNDAFEPYNRLYTMRAYTSRSVGTTSSSGIAPGYTEDVTQVNPISSSRVQLNSTMYSFMTRERQLNLGGKHEFDRWKLDYDANYNYSHPNLGNGRTPDQSGGIFTMNTTKTGWILDKTGSDIYPQFTQTSGASLSSIASYGSGQLVTRNGGRDTDIYAASANASYVLPTTLKAIVKAGARYRSERFDVTAGDRQWAYAGGALGSLVDPSIVTSGELRHGIDLPYVESSLAMRSIREHPEFWKENLYYAESGRLSDSSQVTEDVLAAYLQSQVTVKRLRILIGSRFERTDVDAFGRIAAKSLTTAAQQAADPIGSARLDYDHPQTTRGHYADWFPGVYLTYRIAPNLQARANWSNSIGRPAASQLTPSRTVSDTNGTVTINNPSLKPQHAENWDASLEYYFEPVGLLSVGVFRKDLTDFITSAQVGVIGTGPDNGYNGDYSGYGLISAFNGGNARMQGIELNYQQQFSFLPGLLKGLGVFANYTQLTTNGDYGESTVRSTSEIANFVPKTANGGLTYKYRRFGARVLVNYTGRYLSNYSADPSRLQYRMAKTTVNLGTSYELTKGLSLFCDLANIFNAPQKLYRGLSSSHISAATYNGTVMTFGVSGRF